MIPPRAANSETRQSLDCLPSVPRRHPRRVTRRVFQVYLVASCMSSAALGAHSPPNKWRAALPLYREGNGDSERSHSEKYESKGSRDLENHLSA